MAIDTRNKRGSVIGFDLPFRVFPDPDGSLGNQADRQHMAGKYAFALTAGGVTVVFKKTLSALGARVGVRQAHW